MTRITLPSLFADPDRVAAFRGMGREVYHLLARFGIADAPSPMPSASAAEADVSITCDTLRIAGKVANEVERMEGEFVDPERRRGAFSRAIRPGCEPEAVAIDATLAGGVLTMTIATPARAAPQSREIEVKAG
jgi:hypothetical protein